MLVFGHTGLYTYIVKVLSDLSTAIYFNPNLESAFLLKSIGEKFGKKEEFFRCSPTLLYLYMQSYFTVLIKILNQAVFSNRP